MVHDAYQYIPNNNVLLLKTTFVLISHDLFAKFHESFSQVDVVLAFWLLNRFPFLSFSCWLSPPSLSLSPHSPSLLFFRPLSCFIHCVTLLRLSPSSSLSPPFSVSPRESESYCCPSSFLVLFLLTMTIASSFHPRHCRHRRMFVRSFVLLVRSSINALFMSAE